MNQADKTKAHKLGPIKKAASEYGKKTHTAHKPNPQSKIP